MSESSADKFSRSDAVAVDIGPEALIRHIHLPQARQDLRGAGVEIVSNVLPQFLHNRRNVHANSLQDQFST